MRYALEATTRVKELVDIGGYRRFFSFHTLRTPKKNVYSTRNRRVIENIIREAYGTDANFIHTSNKEVRYHEPILLKDEVGVNMYKSIKEDRGNYAFCGSTYDFKQRFSRGEVAASISAYLEGIGKKLLLSDNHGDMRWERDIEKDILDPNIIQLISWANAERDAGDYQVRRDELIIDGKVLYLENDGQFDGCDVTRWDHTHPDFIGQFRGPIMDDAEKVQLAEVWGNCIFVHFDLSHSDTNFLPLLLFILKKALPLLEGGIIEEEREEWEKKAEERKRKVEERKRKAEERKQERAFAVLVDKMNEKARNEVGVVKREVERAGRDAEDYFTLYKDACKKRDEKLLSLERILAIPRKEVRKEEVMDILNKIRVNKSVSNVRLDGQEIHIDVDNIRTKGRTTPTYYLGNFTIIYDIIYDKITFSSRSGDEIRKRKEYDDCIHPHLFSYGKRPCWGDISPTLDKLKEKGDFTTLTSLLIQFLQSCKYDYKLPDWYTVEEAIKKGLITS